MTPNIAVKRDWLTAAFARFQPARYLERSVRDAASSGCDAVRAIGSAAAASAALLIGRALFSALPWGAIGSQPSGRRHEERARRRRSG